MLRVTGLLRSFASVTLVLIQMTPPSWLVSVVVVVVVVSAGVGFVPFPISASFVLFVRYDTLSQRGIFVDPVPCVPNPLSPLHHRNWVINDPIDFPRTMDEPFPPCHLTKGGHFCDP